MAMNVFMMNDREHAAMMAALRFAEKVGLEKMTEMVPGIEDLSSNAGLFVPLEQTEIGDLATRLNCQVRELHETYEHLIMEAPSEFTGLEMHGVKNVAAPDEDPIYQRNDVTPDFYSVYARKTDGELVCIGDFGTPTLADAFADQIASQHGWSVPNPHRIDSASAVTPPATPAQQTFTVIGFYSDNAQIFAHQVLANDAMHAFAEVAGEHSSAEFICALPGAKNEDEHVFYPGDAVVCAETVLDQPDVFGQSTSAESSNEDDHDMAIDM